MPLLLIIKDKVQTQQPCQRTDPQPSFKGLCLGWEISHQRLRAHKGRAKACPTLKTGACWTQSEGGGVCCCQGQRPTPFLLEKKRHLVPLVAAKTTFQPWETSPKTLKRRARREYLRNETESPYSSQFLIFHFRVNNPFFVIWNPQSGFSVSYRESSHQTWRQVNFLHKSPKPSRAHLPPFMSLSCASLLQQPAFQFTGTNLLTEGVSTFFPLYGHALLLVWWISPHSTSLWPLPLTAPAHFCFPAPTCLRKVSAACNPQEEAEVDSQLWAEIVLGAPATLGLFHCHSGEK